MTGEADGMNLGVDWRQGVVGDAYVDE